MNLAELRAFQSRLKRSLSCVQYTDGVPFNDFEDELDGLEEIANMAESLQAQLAEKDAEIKRLNDEPPAYKFYYCESEDSYLLGYRVGNFYYAHWHDGIGFVFDMSRYLPWGEHVVAPHTAWKEHTYPSEPKEIDSFEWFNGFLAQQLSESQRKEQAAVEDITKYAKTVHTCIHVESPDCHVKDNHEWCARCPAWQYRGLGKE